jgi:hypothetical protein
VHKLLSVYIERSGKSSPFLLTRLPEEKIGRISADNQNYIGVSIRVKSCKLIAFEILKTGNPLATDIVRK